MGNVQACGITCVDRKRDEHFYEGADIPAPEVSLNVSRNKFYERAREMIEEGDYQNETIQTI